MRAILVSYSRKHYYCLFLNCFPPRGVGEKYMREKKGAIIPNNSNIIKNIIKNIVKNIIWAMR